MRTAAWRGVAALALLVLLAVPSPTGAEQAASMPVPVELQLPLLLKVLTYDHQLQLAGPLVMGVVYEPDVEDSVAAKEEASRILEQLSMKTFRGLPIRSRPIPWATTAALEEEVREHDIAVLWVAPGLDALDDLLEVSAARDIRTVTGAPALVEAGVAIGLGVKLGRPEILINLEAAHSQGFQLDASLLRIATVLR